MITFSCETVQKMFKAETRTLTILSDSVPIKLFGCDNFWFWFFKIKKFEFRFRFRLKPVLTGIQFLFLLETYS